ncbi:Methyltransferase-like protein 7B [Grifola frondosa]|uniref:Methyltransferase-like protein 7B n=1 Tax=Grifola frondosa TaxID=5627 RepID=A0A1C7M7E7_GRIFR|nr:Methyltransferase-like protein 7B [Grifola frondosa]
MSHVWTVFGNGIRESRPVKQGLITTNAKGIVLDIGAGHGHTVLYLDRERVTKYIALEPNHLMHDEIRKLAASKGFTESAGTLTILPYGAEDTALIVSALGEVDSVDTLISILTLCSIPRPEQSLKALVDEVLKPGGQLLFYEHVLSPLDDVAWWQRFWTPLWKTAFDGCCLDRPTHVWVRKMAGWSSGEVWGKEGEDEENLFWHRVGTWTHFFATRLMPRARVFSNPILNPSPVFKASNNPRIADSARKWRLVGQNTRHTNMALWYKQLWSLTGSPFGRIKSMQNIWIVTALGQYCIGGLAQSIANKTIMFPDTLHRTGGERGAEPSAGLQGSAPRGDSVGQKRGVGKGYYLFQMDDTLAPAWTVECFARVVAHVRLRDLEPHGGRGTASTATAICSTSSM